jgi:hypothetical protein
VRRRYWLSYDLGLGGSYPELYEWLDRQGAKECGDSCATFMADKEVDEIATELKACLDEKKSRVYLVWIEEGKPRGRFLLGRRKPAPWAGYATAESDEDTEQP